MKKITFLITTLLFFTLTSWSQSPACGDTLYDSGGASGDYVSNELTTVTVYPDVAGDLVTFTFLSFDTESCCDDLTVYDGPSTSSPLVGTYAGSTLPDPITSTDSTGALTFVFDSDGSVQYGGYEILISCGPPPACPAPSAIAASNVTASTADISWSAGGTETAYEYVYQAAGTGEPTGAGTQLTTTSVSLSGLSSSTDYEVFVRSACDDGSFSTWSGPLNFTTACGNFSNPYFEDFSTMTFSTVPDCWFEANNNSLSEGPVTTGSSSWTSDGFGNIGSTGAARFNLYFGGDSDWLVSPVFDISDEEEVLFNVAATEYGTSAATTFSEDYVQFLIKTGSEWTVLTTWDSSRTPSPTGDLVTFNLSSYSGSSVQFAFLAVDDSSGDDEFFVDNFEIRSIPSGVPGCASNFTDTADESCGNYDFSISWDTVSGADGYLLTAGTTSGGNDLVDALDLGSSTTYNFSSVIIGQNYFYTVTPYNANGNADGCEEQSVRTAQEGCYCASVPTSNDGTGISSVSLAGIDFTSGGDITYEDFTTTAVSVGQSTTASLSVSYSTGYTYYTNTWVDFNDDYNFDASELVSSGSSSGTLDLSFLVPSAATIGNHRLRIVGSYYSSYLTNPEPCYNTSWGVTIDMTLDVTEPPACPAPSAIAASNVTASTADISWSAGGTETAYEYVYQAAGTGEPTGAGTQLTTTSVSLSGLSSNTDYEVYVRSACDDGSYSTWSYFNFTTSPACGDTLYDSGGASGNYASNELVTVTVYPDVTGDLVTFTFLSFDTESCCDDLTVYDGPSTSSPLVGTYAGSTLPDPITSTDSTGALTFVFDSDGSLQYGGYEILISCGPLSVDDYTEIDFNYYPNPVNDQLTIKAQRNVENVTVLNMLGQVVLRQSPNSLECVVNMAEMQTGAYFVRVSNGNTIETVRVLKK